MTKKFLIGLGVITLLIIVGLRLLLKRTQPISTLFFSPTYSNKPALAPLPVAGEAPNVNQDIQVIADGLEIPWEIAFLPDGSLLVTERPGRLLKIGTDKTIIPIEGVLHRGEGGLLGLALHPDFARNGLIYLYLTTQEGSAVTNRVERYRLQNTTLEDRTIIIENIPGSTFHDGGRIAFGPDKLLYITTGDAGQEASAQDTNSLAGKILRLKDDGSIPEGNPFSNPTFSYGHRNPQGIAWNTKGELWATEHGRSGVATGFDEVNLIEVGKNYGWPALQGDRTAPGMEAPKAHSGASTTWAPSGAAFYQDRLLFAGLRGQALYDATIEGRSVKEVAARFTNEFGRLRTVTVGPDGMIYIATNNTDGRGTPNKGDDKIIRINPGLLLK
ncbi:MAG: PQQ-dependent sugar dehydrogenase [Candidatus Andersenbacteria bacterium]|nr:PQQ-dependent sugar dehydrogenase [Candidatus Andersenbacteria bacterium]